MPKIHTRLRETRSRRRDAQGVPKNRRVFSREAIFFRVYFAGFAKMRVCLQCTYLAGYEHTHFHCTSAKKRNTRVRAKSRVRGKSSQQSLSSTSCHSPVVMHLISRRFRIRKWLPSVDFALKRFRRV